LIEAGVQFWDLGPVSLRYLGGKIAPKLV
jgi:hypothetical protein